MPGERPLTLEQASRLPCPVGEDANPAKETIPRKGHLFRSFSGNPLGCDRSLFRYIKRDYPLILSLPKGSLKRVTNNPRQHLTTCAAASAYVREAHSDHSWLK
jgi:hypothetical protein